MSKVKPKSPGIILLLSILTCGIYKFFWIYQTTEDLRKLSTTTKIPSGITVILLSILTCGIYNIYWYYLIGVCIESIYLQRSVISPIKSTKYLVLKCIALVLSFCFGIGALLSLLLPMFAQLDLNNVIKFINNNDYFDFELQLRYEKNPNQQGSGSSKTQSSSQPHSTIEIPHLGVRVRQSNTQQAIDDINRDFTNY